MQYKIKRLEKNSVEIRFELTPEDVKPHLEGAAARLSQKTTIPGFRPGHAPYAEVEKRLGAMKILEEALDEVVRKCYLEALTAEKLETLGSPSFEMEKLAPGNPLIFKLTALLLPTITKITDYKSLKLSRQPVEVKDEEIEKILYDLQNMRAKEVRSEKPITLTDHVVLDLVISQAGTPIEGGTSKDHHVLLSEPYYVPGFIDELKDLKEGEEKIFTLSFPKEHYQKMLAGKPAEFKVKIKQVFTRELPKIDNEFAKSFGKKTIEEVRVLLRENLLTEKNLREEERLERSILEQIVAASQFDDIPDLLINEEVERMRHELEHNVAKQGMEWNQYLTHLGKTETQLKLDFAPQALHRLKTTLAAREIAKRENIEAIEKEIDEELDQAAKYYEDDKETREHIYSPEYREHFAMVIRNRKTMTKLKEMIVK